MHRKAYRTLWGILTFIVLLFVAAGFLIGLKFVKEEQTYFVFLNIVSAAYGLLSVFSILAVRKHWKPTPIVLILGNTVLSFGHLYFLEYRMFHLLQLILFALSIVYLIFYLIRFFVFQKGRMETENLHLLNPVAPVLFIAGSFFCKMFLLSGQVVTEMDSFALTFLPVALGCAAVAFIVAALQIKDREDKREYFGKLIGIFCATLILAWGLPSLSASYTNYALDTSSGEKIECVVVEKYQRYNGRGGIEHLVLFVDGQEKDFVFHKAVCAQYAEGDTIYLYRYEGAFGYPCYEYRFTSIFQYQE